MLDDDLLTELLALDERFFEPGAGRALYDQALARTALMVVPGLPPLDRAAALDAAARSEAGDAWADHRIHEGAQLLRLAPEVASITYRATARRQGQEPYHALFSSVYVREDSDWKLALHQQTPVSPPNGDD